jgi:hypothetical protein
VDSYEEARTVAHSTAAELAGGHAAGPRRATNGGRGGLTVYGLGGFGHAFAGCERLHVVVRERTRRGIGFQWCSAAPSPDCDGRCN